jgi:hypothetical protein
MVEYSDGCGRLLQTRTQAEDLVFADSSLPEAGRDLAFGNAVLPPTQPNPGSDAVGYPVADQVAKPRVVVSGWQVYDNKGRVVEKYEPFFDEGWDYVPAIATQYGQKTTMFYGPRGQVIRTVNPDGSEQRVIYGVPTDLSDSDPQKITPTPWEAYAYDANDNAGRTPTADPKSNDYEHHWNTPASILIDALGRTVMAKERNRVKPINPTDPFPPIEEYLTSSSYHIRGNLLEVTDALGRVAFRHVYDLANRPLRIESIDAGTRRIVLDAAGNEVELRDNKGALMLHAYDTLNRPTYIWARDDDTNGTVTLRERLIYGDNPKLGLTLSQIAAANLRGKLHQHYDEAGKLTYRRYDFKGNALEKVHQVINDGGILAKFNPPPANWQVAAFRVPD